jgi:outer membrane receptor for ferrienterochelin and colicin
MSALKIYLNEKPALAFALLMLILGLNGHVFAHNHQEELFEMTIEELMDVEVSVASRKGLTVRQAPGIVTVITRDQIQKSGARDLIDILVLTSDLIRQGRMVLP